MESEGLLRSRMVRRPADMKLSANNLVPLPPTPPMMTGSVFMCRFGSSFLNVMPELEAREVYRVICQDSVHYGRLVT
jgi:hypothetical protein